MLGFAFLTDPALPSGNPLKAISPDLETVTLEFSVELARHRTHMATIRPAKAHPGSGFHVLEVIGN